MIKLTTNELIIDNAVLQEILNHLSSYVYIKNLNFEYIYINELVAELFNYPKNMNFTDFNVFEESLLKEQRNNDIEVLNGKTIFAEEILISKKNQEKRVYKSVKGPIYNNQNKVIGLIGISTDVTELYLLNEQVQNYMHLTDEHIISSFTDIHGVITAVSNAFCKISGYRKDELIGKNHNIVRHEDMSNQFFKELWQTILKEEKWQGEIKNKRKDGKSYWVNAKISPCYNDKKELIGFMSVREDITDKKNFEQLSITDALTGTYNRRHFNIMVPKIIESSKRNNELICFILFDIDNFKLYNDTYGHLKGDDALKIISKVFLDNLKRADDYCFRIGGEEFVIVCKTKSERNSIEFSKKIIKEVEEKKLKLNEKYLTVSAGLICEYACEIYSIDAVYKRIDSLLYHAKNNGKNRVEIKVGKSPKEKGFYQI